jgi:polyhydroxyalkanoate synthesis regulator phasin
MDPAAIVSLVAAGSGVAGYILKRLVDHLLGRGRIQVDEATKIRTELRKDLERKDKQIEELEARKDRKIEALEKRVDTVELELERSERERLLREEKISRERIAVYQALIEYGASRELVNAVLTIQER